MSCGKLARGCQPFPDSQNALKLWILFSSMALGGHQCTQALGQGSHLLPASPVQWAASCQRSGDGLTPARPCQLIVPWGLGGARAHSQWPEKEFLAVPGQLGQALRVGLETEEAPSCPSHAAFSGQWVSPTREASLPGHGPWSPLHLPQAPSHPTGLTRPADRSASGGHSLGHQEAQGPGCQAGDGSGPPVPPVAGRVTVQLPQRSPGSRKGFALKRVEPWQPGGCHRCAPSPG